MKFILIMTLCFGSSSKSTSIEAVEFNTKEACLSAGEAWTRQVSNTGIDLNYKFPTYICAAKGSP